MANMLTLLLNHLVKLYSTAFSKSPRKTLSLGLFGSNGMRKNPWTNTLDPNVKSKALIHIANTIFVVYFSLPRSTSSVSSTGVTCTVVPDVPRLRRKGRRDVANRFLKICFWKIASALEFALPRYRRSNSWTGLLWIWKKRRWSEKCFSRFKSIPLSVLWHSTPPLHSLHLSSIPVQSFIIQFYSQRKNWQKLLSAFLHLSTMTITGLVVPASPHAIAPGIDVSTL